MFHTKVAEQIKTHILSESRAVYDIMRENTVERDRPQMANMAHEHYMLDN
jgi:hypothetical protein